MQLGGLSPGAWAPCCGATECAACGNALHSLPRAHQRHQLPARAGTPCDSSGTRRATLCTALVLRFPAAAALAAAATATPPAAALYRIHSSTVSLPTTLTYCGRCGCKQRTLRPASCSCSCAANWRTARAAPLACTWTWTGPALCHCHGRGSACLRRGHAGSCAPRAECLHIGYDITGDLSDCSLGGDWRGGMGWGHWHADGRPL